MIPYSRQAVDQSDIDAVALAMQSDLLTQGPLVEQFEREFIQYSGGRYCSAVSSGTSALHVLARMVKCQIDECRNQIIIPAITFVATAHAFKYEGFNVIFADVDEDTLLVDWDDVETKVTDNTAAVVGMDYAGQSCADDKWLLKVRRFHAVLDACHSVGIQPSNWYNGLAYSFHATKNMTTGEGGMVCGHLGYANPMRNHGRYPESSEITELGYNYRMNEMSAALGISQLKKLPGFIKKRQAIAARYDEAFKDLDRIRPLTKLPDREHAYHLYVIKTDNRDELKELLAKDGIETQIHYKPVNLQPYYNQKGVAPVAERVWMEILSIPIYPGLTNNQQEYVIDRITEYRG